MTNRQVSENYYEDQRKQGNLKGGKTRWRGGAKSPKRIREDEESDRSTKDKHKTFYGQGRTKWFHLRIAGGQRREGGGFEGPPENLHNSGEKIMKTKGRKSKNEVVAQKTPRSQKV